MYVNVISNHKYPNPHKVAFMMFSSCDNYPSFCRKRQKEGNQDLPRLQQVPVGKFSLNAHDSPAGYYLQVQRVG